MFRIELAQTQPAKTAHEGPEPIADVPIERAIRDGTAKLPMLESTRHLRLLRLRDTASPQTGLRPRLSRAHRALLTLGLRALSRRDAAFASLDPTRRPKLLVLCDTAQLMRGARWSLTRCGLDKATVAARTIIDSLPAFAALADARISVVVVLRSNACARPPAAILATALPSLWPEPDFAALRCENRERSALGRAPDNLIDVLSVVEHPQCHADYAGLLRAGLAVHGDDRGDPNPIGDLFVAPLRTDADVFDLAFEDTPPPLHGDRVAAQDDERLSEIARQILRTRQSMPVRKSIYTHAGWSGNDSGLRRAFVECAEADPQIESHCLLDPRRHGTRSRDRQILHGISSKGLPEAMVSTAEAIYLVDFLPFCPAQPPAADAHAPTGSCTGTNALPAAQRQHRYWYRVQLQAPLFWSWKRSDGALSTLLSALAGSVAS